MLFAGTAPSTTLADGNTAMLSGILRDYASGKPIQNATIVVRGPSQTDETETDRFGAFYFFSVLPNHVVVAVATPGLEPICTDGNVGANEHVIMALQTYPALRGLPPPCRPFPKSGITADVYDIF